MALVVLAALLGACSGGEGAAPRSTTAAATSAAPSGPARPAASSQPSDAPQPPMSAAVPAIEVPATEVPVAPPPSPPRSPSPAPGTVRPAWLGTRVLPDGPNGYPLPQDTPPELDPRRLTPAAERLPPPADGAFAATVQPVPPDVAARSTWSPACPVALDDLAYVTVAFWGFDDAPHTGELIVNAAVADDLVGVFRQLYEARFPIEDIGIATPADLDAPPTGDGNVSGAFTCRPTRGSTSWSEHAYGLALDLNPFQNPYVKGGRVLPELATAYLDRARVRPGMILPGDVATAAFAAIGWTWGGDFRSLTDTMHFSRDGR